MLRYLRRLHSGGSHTRHTQYRLNYGENAVILIVRATHTLLLLQNRTRINALGTILSFIFTRWSRHLEENFYNVFYRYMDRLFGIDDERVRVAPYICSVRYFVGYHLQSDSRSTKKTSK